MSISGVSASPVAGSGTLTYRVNSSSWTTIDMAGSGDSYVATIPGQECGSIVDYYVSADASNGQSYSSSTYSVLAATDLVIAFDDDFDTNQGWTVVNLCAITIIVFCPLRRRISSTISRSVSLSNALVASSITKRLRS